MVSLRAPHSRLAALSLAVVWLVPLLVTPVFAKPQLTPRPTLQAIQLQGDGLLSLDADAPRAPASYGSFRRFGLYDSSPTSLSIRFNRITIRYTRTVPDGTAAQIDVRGQTVRGTWSEWELDVAPNAVVRFAQPVTAVQYRVVLLSNSDTSPSVGDVTFTGASNERSFQADAGPRYAPTYRLRATRQGMVGGRTANGHIITENDFFVALPSARALSSLEGREYQVRLSANGRSVVVPVMDRGPWNYNDDYWNENRQTYKDLPVGWPEDHAAYYENYNGGMADKGYVRYPTAVDIGDGAYWALGLEGAQATVNVTFLWLGEDPGPNAAPLNNHPSIRPGGTPPSTETPQPTPSPTPQPTPQPTPEPEPQPPVVINDTDGEFTAEGPGWRFTMDPCAYGGVARWTSSTGTDDASHQALWRPTLRGGNYDVYAYVPACSDATSTRAAQYIVQHAQDYTTVTVDQAATAGTWVYLGRFSFAAGTAGYVQLRNNGAEEDKTVWFDAVKWIAAP